MSKSFQERVLTTTSGHNSMVHYTVPPPIGNDWYSTTTDWYYNDWYISPMYNIEDAFVIHQSLRC